MKKLMLIIFLLGGLCLNSYASDSVLSAGNEYTNDEGYTMIGSVKGLCFDWFDDCSTPHWIKNNANLGLYEKNGQKYVCMSVDIHTVRFVKYQRNNNTSFNSVDVSEYRFVAHYKDRSTDMYVFFNIQ